MDRKARVGCVLLLLLWTRPLAATDNYEYEAGEYAIISAGRSPDGHWSVASHGGGPYGYEDFDLYLMREPAHERLARFHIRGPLDTGPLSIVALWAPDSNHVAVLNRSDRHVLDLRLFSVEGGRVKSMKVPSLVNLAGQKHLKPGVHSTVFSRWYRVTWESGERFILEEGDTLDAAEPVINAGIEEYVTLDRLGPERTFAEFSAKAVCEMTGNGELRIVSVKPMPRARETIVFSPHLRYDSQRGLHNTETTASSLGAKEGKK